MDVSLKESGHNSGLFRKELMDDLDLPPDRANLFEAGFFLRRIQVCLRYCRTLCLSNVCIYSPSETAGMNKIHNLKHISVVVKQKVV